jgi:hypothetical protein
LRGEFAIEKGKVMSVRPEFGILDTLHDMPTSPMVRVGRSDAAAAMRKGEVFILLMTLEGREKLKQRNPFCTGPLSHVISLRPTRVVLV